MKASNDNRITVCGFSLMVCLFVSLSVFGQTEKLGILEYTPPKNWTKTPKENIVIFNEVNHSTGGFCFITLYGATPGTGNPKTDFANEWKNLVVKPWNGEANPKTETEAEDGWTAIAGGSAIEFQGGQAVAFLTVFSRNKITFSVLGIFNDETYLEKLVAFVSSIKEDKTAETPTKSANSASAPPQIVNGKLVIPMPTRQLTMADLAGEWGQNDGITTTYVDRYTGAYAGFESLHFTDRMTITAQGEYYSDFFALQNGRKIKEKTSGTIIVTGRLIVISQGNIRKYVVRGWLELSDMTILEVCGPWYDDDVIPDEIFSNPEQGANLNKRWVRKK